MPASPVIGFRCKTGRAFAIAVALDKGAPVYLQRWDLPLHDPRVPATGQPHHEVMELPWAEAKIAVRPIEKRIIAIATDALSDLIKEVHPSAIAVVGSPDRELERLGNPHIRAHAAEGILFRRSIELAADKLKIRHRFFSDRDINEIAEEYKEAMARIGAAAGRPWRIDERAAAAAAWATLLTRPASPSTRAARP